MKNKILFCLLFLSFQPFLYGEVVVPTGNVRTFSSDNPTFTNATFTGTTTLPSGIWDSSGKVSIGTTSSTAKKLYVEGTIQMTGAINANTLAIDRGVVTTNTAGDLSATNNPEVFGLLYGTYLKPTQNGVAIEAPSASDQYLLFKVNDTESGLVEIGRLQGASDPWWGIGSFYALRSGSVGIGTNTPSAQFHTTGTLRHANFGAGAATFDANGNISSVSDERLKIIVGTFTAGLAELMGINPILHKYNELSGLDMENVYAGFSAQNVMQFIPEAVGQDSRGYYSLSDRPIVAALVNAVKDLQKEIDALKGKTAIAITEYKITPITSTDRLVKSKPLPSPKPMATPTP